MDIFKFESDVINPEPFDQGVMVHGWKSAMWAERYSTPGEFEIVAPLRSGVREFLPRKSLISHTNTLEVMVVENHQISDEEDGETMVRISGRSAETLFENRSIGANRTWDPTNGTTLIGYTLAQARVWDQVETLIRPHISTTAIDDDDAFSNTQVTHENVPLATGLANQQARSLKFQQLSSGVDEMMALDDLGMRTVRPGSWSPLAVDGHKDLAFVVHKGVDRTAEVVFSYHLGEIENADYLWSIKNLKTSALITGRWLGTMVHGPETGYDRRTMIVDASDLDSDYSAAPTGSARTAIVAKMQSRGQQALASQNEVAISNPGVSQDFSGYRYRTDYGIGDLVSVDGNYDTSAVMRVVEYVEIEDEDGVTNYPTLSIPASV